MKDLFLFIATAATTALLSLGAVTALSPVSQAEEPARTKVLFYGPPSFSEVDADHDGMITEEEFLYFFEASREAVRFPSGGDDDRFAEADVDGDGRLSREEYEAAPRRIVRRALRTPDPKELFARADQDQDSVLTEEEFEALFETLPRLDSDREVPER